MSHSDVELFLTIGQQVKCDKEIYRRQDVDLNTIRNPNSFVLKQCEGCIGICGLAILRNSMEKVYGKKRQSLS